MKTRVWIMTALQLLLCLVLACAPGLGEASDSSFEMDGDTLVAVHGMKKEKTIRVPEGVRTIGPAVFRGLRKLEKVVLPDSVEEIQELAFADCTSLKKVSLSDNSGLRIIGSRAFENCTSLNSRFASKVEQVAQDAFDGTATASVYVGKDSEGSDGQIDGDPDDEIPEEDKEAGDGGTGSGKRQTHRKSKSTVTHGYDQVDVTPDEEDRKPMHTLTLDGEELELTLTDGTGAPREFTVSLYDWSHPEQNGEEAAAQGNTLILWAVAPGGDESGAAAGEEAAQDPENAEAEKDAAEAEKETPKSAEAEKEAAETAEAEKDAAEADKETPKSAEAEKEAAETAEPEEPEKETPTAAPAGESAGDGSAAQETELLIWKMNGAVMRKLKRSGIDYLAFRVGDRVTAVPTEGFLAGWAYDELKSRGTAGRRFEYACAMNGAEEEPRWSVTVEGRTWELEEDPFGEIYLTGVENGTNEILQRPKEG